MWQQRACARHPRRWRAVAAAMRAPSRCHWMCGVSKLTLPWNTEAGYGALAFDGTLRLNEMLMTRAGLSEADIEAGKARAQEKVKQDNHTPHRNTHHPHKTQNEPKPLSHLLLPLNPSTIQLCFLREIQCVAHLSCARAFRPRCLPRSGRRASLTFHSGANVPSKGERAVPASVFHGRVSCSPPPHPVQREAARSPPLPARHRGMPSTSAVADRYRRRACRPALHRVRLARNTRNRLCSAESWSTLPGS